MDAPPSVCRATIRLGLRMRGIVQSTPFFQSFISVHSGRADVTASAELRLRLPAWRTGERVVLFSAKIAMGRRRTK